MKKHWRSRIALITTIIMWLLIGEPVIWKNPRIPPELRNIFAASPETFTTNGTFTPENGIYAVTVECWGGGGSGGGLTTNRTICRGGGGAGGQYVIDSGVGVTPGIGYSVVIGVGGTGSTGDGVAGGDSTFNTNTVVAKGGAGGQSYESGYAAGQGSISGGIGDTVYDGGNGSAGGTGATGGAGGGGAGSGGSGGDASGNTAGTGTATGGGAGGAGLSSSANGNIGTIYAGAGGAGGSTVANKNTDFYGGNGANGRCIVSYSDNLAPSTSQTTY
jgi:hypothetical protein